MNLTTSLSLAFLFATTAVAQQTQLVRGKVEDIPQTPNFVLDCTNIPLVSNVLNLNTMVGLQFDLQVVNLGTATNPRLNVVSAVAVNKIFDMGNLRIGRPENWEIRGPSGSAAAAWLTATSLTGYFPLGAAGTWLLAGPTLMVASGTIGNGGQFQFTVTTPNVPELIGVMFTAQGAYGTPAGQLVITNPDCKEVRAN